MCLYTLTDDINWNHPPQNLTLRLYYTEPFDSVKGFLEFFCFEESVFLVLVFFELFGMLLMRGERELCDIQPTDVLTIVRRLEARGTFELAHVEGNSVRAAYNYAEHLSERRKMMQWWGDYLDRLRLD